MSQLVATFYKFVQLADCADTRKPLLTYCLEQGLKGTILLAEEGINGAIAGSPSAVHNLLAFLRADLRLADLAHSESITHSSPFDRMKVKLKKEIVTLGMPEINPSQQVGTYVRPQEWNALISDPDVMVIDVRNTFEIGVGTFARSHDPQTGSFRQFPNYVQTQLDPQHHKKIAMFCTGGIRCEKASALMLAQGFEEVYHLQGGILSYLKAIPREESLWQGECFVFDQRVAVTQGVEDGSYKMCRACGHPISQADQSAELDHVGRACSYCGASFDF
ncbi:rhodanese-related sulfurtransferase [Myxacorys almedinensis]|uniref:tRNA uridine(34) hydroxylase n=1 Tax=Myxacorys almedinensis A TaxID=2690445 RepID=A0A8J8CJQ1_9CYAN|nr:rhodanese-related sulfurtransferase [Myxacorys almedinensis]NDJ17841.1 rhodanese-related sulfurtransferase [Myxacorys almedinensis A]